MTQVDALFINSIDMLCLAHFELLAKGLTSGGHHTYI